MAEGGKLIDIYFASSFKDLQEKAQATQLSLQKGSAKTTLAHADCLWHQAEKKKGEGDEELAYFFLYRCVEAVIAAKGKKDFRVSTRGFEHLSEEDLRMKLGDLRCSLEKRYTIREEDEAAGFTNRNQDHDNYSQDEDKHSQDQNNHSKDEDKHSQLHVEQLSHEKEQPTKKTETEVVSKPVVVNVCEVRVPKMPLSLFSFVQTSSPSSSDDRSMKITVLDLNPKPAISTVKAVELCENLKKNLNYEEIGGGPDLFITIKVGSFSEATKLVSLNLLVDGPLVDLLRNDYQGMKMLIDMRLYGKKNDQIMTDAVLKWYKNRSGEAVSLGAKVGLLAQDEWMGATASEPKAKLTVKLVGDVE